MQVMQVMQNVTGGRAAPPIRMPDVLAAVEVEVAVRAGGSIVRLAEVGPHELRTVVRDLWENALVIYGPL